MKHRIFWGVAIIVLGVFFLLAGMYDLDVWRFLWPSLLIIAGIWFLLVPAFARQDMAKVEKYTFPLEGIEKAIVHIEHGAGLIKISPLNSKEKLLSGEFLGGVYPRVARIGDRVRVVLKSKAEFFNVLPRFTAGKGLNWDLRINQDVPLTLKIESGASENQLDLTEMQVHELKLKTGASSTQINLPKNAGYTKVKVESGAASLEIHIPKDTAARIHVKGLVTKEINRKRFPLRGNYYQSEDYESAKNRVEIQVESGLGSVEIK